MSDYETMIADVKRYKAYTEISHFYHGKTTERSRVPLMNHIEEGMKILFKLECRNQKVYHAWCLHPLLQRDEDLSQNWLKLTHQNKEWYGTPWPESILLAMEYRNIANQSLSDIVTTEWRGNGPHHDYPVLILKRDIKLSPLTEVNHMLIADKVQNRKDFELYHKGTHERSDELDFYFKAWLKALIVSEDEYQALIKDL